MIKIDYTLYLYCTSPHSTTYVCCPANQKQFLGIKLPFLVMIIKNMKKYFTFEVQVPIPATYNCHVCMYVHSKKLGETTVFSQSSSYMTVWKSHARFWMTKMSDGGSEPPTTSQRPEWNRSSAPCPWDLTMGGTRSSSISPTSPGELTGPTTLRLLGSRWVMSRSWGECSSCIVINPRRHGL